ncbi:hypothetical protein EJB05_55781, partial [Eragrostis curvula]
MHPSPASASSAVTTASGGGDACSFGAMYSSPSTLQQQAPPLARYVDAAMPAPPHQQQQHAPTSLAEFSAAGVANNGGWVTGGGMALEDMFLPELLGAGEFPSSGDLVFGASGFGPLLLQDRAASASLQELSACYFPNAQAEMWAAAADIKPPTGLCHGLT